MGAAIRIDPQRMRLISLTLTRLHPHHQAIRKAVNLERSCVHSQTPGGDGPARPSSCCCIGCAKQALGCHCKFCTVQYLGRAPVIGIVSFGAHNPGHLRSLHSPSDAAQLGAVRIAQLKGMSAVDNKYTLCRKRSPQQNSRNHMGCDSSVHGFQLWRSERWAQWEAPYD